jgi:hypothetical protein
MVLNGYPMDDRFFEFFLTNEKGEENPHPLVS